MRDLTEIRQQIDQIDQKMLALFKERMGCSAEVAEYKRGTGKAIYDPVRVPDSGLQWKIASCW